VDGRSCIFTPRISPSHNKTYLQRDSRSTDSGQFPCTSWLAPTASESFRFLQIWGRIPFGKAGSSGTPGRCQKTDDVHVGLLASEQPAAFTAVDVFHAIEGEYILEIGSERFRLKSGDSILAPREVPSRMGIRR